MSVSDEDLRRPCFAWAVRLADVVLYGPGPRRLQYDPREHEQEKKAARILIATRELGAKDLAEHLGLDVEEALATMRRIWEEKR